MSPGKSVITVWGKIRNGEGKKERGKMDAGDKEKGV